MLTILIFILVLGVLVFVHELGHFAVARFHGIKADELLYSGISAIVVAQLLEKARIQTKISIVFDSGF